jgi:hypothetical protein
MIIIASLRSAIKSKITFLMGSQGYVSYTLENHKRLEPICSSIAMIIPSMCDLSLLDRKITLEHCSTTIVS